MEIDSFDALHGALHEAGGEDGYVVQLLPLVELRPHEEHDHEAALQLSRTIALDGFVTRPVVVEKQSRTLLDGHHRVAALALLGCAFVPSVLLSYDDPRIALDGWRPDVSVDRHMVLAASLRGHLLPWKTTRHRLNPDLGQIKVELALLNPEN